MLSGGRGPSAVLTLTHRASQCSQRAAGPGGTGASEPVQLLPVIPLQRGGEFPARLTSRASQQCCSEIHLIVNCSCSTAPLQCPSTSAGEEPEPAVASLPGLLSVCCACARGPARSTVFCTPSSCARRGQVPTMSAAHVKICSLVFSAFQLASLAKKHICEPPERAIPGSPKPGEGLPLMLQYTARLKNCYFFGGNIC